MTGFRDCRGLPLTSGSQAALVAYREGIERWLARQPGASDRLREAVAADEGFALARVALAFALDEGGNAEGSREALAAARALTRGASRWERSHAEAAASALSGAPWAAAHVLEHLAEFPADALLLRQALSLIAFGGQPGRIDEALAMVRRVASAYGEDWWFAGVSALAHSEAGLFEHAARVAQRSLAWAPKNVVGTHALVHVLCDTGEEMSALTLLGGCVPDYDRRAPFLRHLWWHLGVCELALGRLDGARAAYDRGLDPERGESPAALPEAASLLWWISLRDTGRSRLPWESLRALAIGPDAARSAFDASYASLALAGAEDGASLAALGGELGVADPLWCSVTRQVAAPLVEGVAAFVAQDHARAARLLGGVADQLVRLGGGNLHLEVFEDTLVEACLRAGLRKEAREALDRRGRRRRATRDEWWAIRLRRLAGGTPTPALPDTEAAEPVEGGCQ